MGPTARAQILVNGALGCFKKAGVLEETAHQLYRITDRGRQLLAGQTGGITAQDLRRYDDFDAFFPRAL